MKTIAQPELIQFLADHNAEALQLLIVIAAVTLIYLAICASARQRLRKTLMHRFRADYWLRRARRRRSRTQLLLGLQRTYNQRMHTQGASARTQAKPAKAACC